MKKFIKSNKKLLFIFLFFLFLTLASGIYLKIEPTDNTNYQTAAIGGQNPPLKQTPNPISSGFLNPAVENKNSESPPAAKNTIQKPETGQKYIFYVEEKKHEISLAGNITVYDLMDSLKQRGDIVFGGKTSVGLGFFVEEINGKKNDSKTNTYWIYYINGKAAGVGISNYILKPEDIISWKYEIPQF